MNCRAKLSTIFKDEQILTDAESLKIYGGDWTKNFSPNASAIVLPKSTIEVQKLVILARSEKWSLVPSGGRTGLSAAAYALNKEIVVSFEKMNSIKSFDPVAKILTCEAGVILEEIQLDAKKRGFYYPVDFAARGSCQIGGTIATNAGGIKVIRYGLTRNWVAGLKVVTGAGEILDLNKSLVKNATGYDFRHLFIGSEGTLGLVTEVNLKLTLPPTDPRVLVLGVNELKNVMNIFEQLSSSEHLLAFEMFTELCLKYVVEQMKLPRPFDSVSDYYLLIEFDGKKPEEEVLSLIELFLEKEWISDGTISLSTQQAHSLWRLREDITEATSHKSPYKNDVSVKISAIPEFLHSVSEILTKEYPTYEVVWFGHIGDGNLHINILKPDEVTADEFMANCSKVSQILFSKIEEFQGSVSAEHGVGLTKKPFLHHTRSAVEIELMKGIKKTFDPDLILNPGKIFDIP